MNRSRSYCLVNPIGLWLNASALFFGLLLIIIFMLSAPVLAANKPPDPDDERCFKCHAQDFRTGIRPDGMLYSIYIDRERYADSKHRSVDGLGCVDCHGKYSECTHLTVGNLYDYLAKTKSRCAGCHEKKQECLECHSKRLNWEPINSYVVSISAHKKLKCKDCHGFEPDIHYDSELRPAAVTGRESCGRCHKKEQKAYLHSIHGEILKERSGHAPGCVDCHGSHYIRPLGKESGEMILRQSQPYVCGECHHEEFITYEENYHGRTVTSFNSHKSPTCYDCHGNHDIKSLKNEKEALTACRECHKNATRKMTGFVIHAHENDAKKEPVLFGVKMAMTTLLVGTLGAFYAHSGLWFYRKRKEMKYGPDDFE